MLGYATCKLKLDTDGKNYHLDFSSGVNKSIFT